MPRKAEGTIAKPSLSRLGYSIPFFSFGREFSKFAFYEGTCLEVHADDICGKTGTKKPRKANPPRRMVIAFSVVYPVLFPAFRSNRF